MSRELMQQALEAFEWNYNTDLDNIPACEQWAKMLKKNIAALRERLAQPEQKCAHEIDQKKCDWCKPARQEQEPVAWMHNFIEGGISIGKKPTDLNRHPDRWTALYKDPTPCKTCQALAMAVMNDQTYHEKIIPKREWVGLTDEEISAVDWKPNETLHDYARHIELKLRGKNT